MADTAIAFPDLDESSDSVRVQRHFTNLGQTAEDVLNAVVWESRTAVVGKFTQEGVEFPASWSVNATNIVASKYFRGQLGSPDREYSVKQMIGRVAGTITQWGLDRGYFGSERGDVGELSLANSEHPASVFMAELTWILLDQDAAFNSPVWFNVGFEDKPQCSACFILSVEDTMESILDWNTKEGRIFVGGSGSGINLSRIRSSKEPLSKGGLASGPVSYMRGADAWAGTIKSGGKTRRAAKMVILDVDHPDIVEFIECKAHEEEKAAVLKAAGIDVSLNGDDAFSLQYQNANNSVRVTDEFMQAVENDEMWQLIARVSGEPIGDPIPARKLMQIIAKATWRCADPGMQFDTTINSWHTCPTSGRINASNPCSEYMHVDNSACNLASLNLMKFRQDDGKFNVVNFTRVIDIVFLAQEITIGTSEQPASSFPTEEIGENARAFRQIGLGYANLGAYLMSLGLPYDSDEGRSVASAITSLMTGQAYSRSAEIAEVMGPYARYPENKEAHDAVMRKHLQAAMDASKSWRSVDDGLCSWAKGVWESSAVLGSRHGFRNAQATVLAPTGTISFMMDCDTTGVEPGFSLVTKKTLVGGGTMTMVNQTVGLALSTLGYSAEETTAIVNYLKDKETIIGAPGLKDEHLPVFDVAVGERAVSWRGHVDMMGAVQPFISGAISKTVNVPNAFTAEDIADAYMHAWNIGVKALAIYRDGSKATQVLQSGTKDGAADGQVAEAAGSPVRRKMPRERQSLTHKFSIGGHKGYITAGMYEDGTVGEIFLTDIGKEGSTLRGMMNAYATMVSIALQYGVPLERLAEKFSYMKFEPEGMTQNSEIPFAKSMPDYIMRWLASRFCDTDLQDQLNILTPEVRARRAALQGETAATTLPLELAPAPVSNGSGVLNVQGKICPNCGGLLQPTGTCDVCPSCWYDTGCAG